MPRGGRRARGVAGAAHFLRVRILGHRGAPACALENTLPSIARALAGGADGIECDLRVSRDGGLFLLHDPDLARVAGRPERLRMLTAREARKVELYGGCLLATLDELCDHVREEAGRSGSTPLIDLELKEGDIEKNVTETLRRHDLSRLHVVVTSFDARQMARASRLAHGWDTGLLDQGRRPRPARSALQAGCRWLAGSWRFPAILARARRAGLRTVVWTVDDPGAARRYAQLPVDAICTNAPELLVRDLARHAGSGFR